MTDTAIQVLPVSEMPEPMFRGGGGRTISPLTAAALSLEVGYGLIVPCRPHVRGRCPDAFMVWQAARYHKRRLRTYHSRKDGRLFIIRLKAKP